MEFCVQVKRFGLKLKYNARCNAKYEVTNYEHKCLQSVTPLLHCSAMMCHCLAPPTQYTVANCSNTRVHFIGDVGLPIVYRYNACLRKLIPADSVFLSSTSSFAGSFAKLQPLLSHGSKATRVPVCAYGVAAVCRYSLDDASRVPPTT